MFRNSIPPSRQTRNQKLRCDCHGYWFPHRRGGGACEASRTREYHWARRRGESHQDAMIEQLWHNPGKPVTGEPPF
jgi:hypothetical protein